MTTRIQRNYKNGLFLMIFGNKPALLSLYNAIRGSDYKNPDDLIINTIEGVLYLGMKLDIYSRTQLKLPTPHYIVFYNGTKEESDSKVLRLSDSFIKHDGPEACLECTATMININYGHNQKLMEACRELYEYSYLIEQIRIELRNHHPLSDAVDLAVTNCINNNILKNFLLRHQAEVKYMILEEFDLEKQLRLVKKGERISIAQNAFAMGLSVEQVASLCAEQADIVQKWFDEWIIAENPSPNSSNIN